MCVSVGGALLDPTNQSELVSFPGSLLRESVLVQCSLIPRLSPQGIGPGTMLERLLHMYNYNVHARTTKLEAQQVILCVIVICLL